MEINYQDTSVLQCYIYSYLLNKTSKIELLIDKEKCNNIAIQENFNTNDFLLKLNNISVLLNYLKDNNIFIQTWKLRTNHNLFIDNNWFKIMDLLYDYFQYFNSSGKIIYTNDYIFCNNLELKNKVEEYLQRFSNIGITILLPYYTYLNSNTNIDIISFIKTYNEKIFLIINPEDIKIEDCQKWFSFLTENNLSNDIIQFILNKNVLWTNEQINNFLTLLDYLINFKFVNNYNCNKEEFCEYVLGSMDNNSMVDPLVIEYFDKKHNNLSCHLSTTLTINCEDLSLPTCCGLCYSSFTGGQFSIMDNKIINLEASEGINGFLNQKITNTLFMPDCYACKNKYFCLKGCRALQFEENVEPFIPIENICILLDSKLNLQIKKYHELGLFDILFSNKKFLLEKQQKYHLIKLLKDKGYPEYEYRYCE